MSQINPFLSSILQSPQVQRQQATEKDRQVRQTNEAVKVSGLLEDQLEHEVESSEEVNAVHDDDHHERRFSRGKHPHGDSTPPEDQDEESHIDLKA